MAGAHTGVGSPTAGRRWTSVTVALPTIAIACGGSAQSEQGGTGGPVTTSGSPATTKGNATATTSAGGAGGTSNTSSTTGGACAAQGFCADCSTGRRLQTICLDDGMSCPAGLSLDEDCPEGSCGATLDYCCNTTTGSLQENVCGEDGYRESCPDGSEPAREFGCRPEALPTADCWSLNGLACSGPAQHCRDQSFAEVTCECVDLGEEDGQVWDCTSWFRS
jgi:hypothetical protein